jgi:hypothetical protein
MHWHGCHKIPANGHRLSFLISSMPQQLSTHGVQNPLSILSEKCRGISITMMMVKSVKDNNVIMDSDGDAQMELEGVCASGGKSDLARDEGVKMWLLSIEDTGSTALA